MSTSLTRRTMFGTVGGAAALGWLPSQAGALARQDAPTLDDLPTGPDIDWVAVRKRFLLPDDYAFMNNGSMGACPDYVVAHTLQAWRRLELAPVYQGYGPMLDDADAARVRVATFLGVGADDVAITASTTDAMNLVAEGIDLQPGDRVLTTDQEHPGGMRCWEHCAAHRDVHIDYVALPVPADDPDEIVRRMEEKFTPRTRVVSVSHVTFTTGLKLPIPEIALLARARGALMVVDGAQAPGGMRVDVSALDCDAYATSAHKWMLAPKGSGALYIRPEARDAIRPIRLQDGLNVHTPSTGMANLPGAIGIGAAVEFLERLGMEAIELHNFALRAHLVEVLRGVERVRVVSPPAGPLASLLVSVELPDDVDNAAIHQNLREQYRISTKKLPREAHFNGLRFTAHIYNRAEDYDRLATALKHELGSGS